ncbi:lysophosphatidylcholine acyltransferase [Anaeramoeba flamelloides]|uniref:Lysophosphatidylcholine acyltransferase n=1 Tax=Anaeramoeba flamelloides TaxID=1746091 RepID=A0AAV7ZEA3_9EUKA|nr:lysophosphatidylcholine acyltransferase [Anaeramoeba flamelloides]
MSNPTLNEKPNKFENLTRSEVEKIPRVTPYVLNKYSKFQFVMMIISFFVTLAPIRVLLIGTLMISLQIVLFFLTLGLDTNKPFPKKRKAMIQKSVRFVSRSVLFLVGISRIKVNGKENQKKIAECETERIIISNHISILDIPVSMALFSCIFLAKAETKNNLFVGSLVKNLQGMFVKRTKNKKDGWIFTEIERRCKNDDYIPLCIFPEGTTSNGKCIVSFKMGAFSAGYPLHPIILKYKPKFPFKNVNIAYALQSPVMNLLEILSTMFIEVEVDCLDCYYPSEEEKKNPKLLRDNVRKYMGEKSGYPLVDSSFFDKKEYIRYLKLKKNK